MTIQEAQEKIKELAAGVTTLCVQFESETGLQIHSVPVDHDTPHAVVKAHVKAQIRG